MNIKLGKVFVGVWVGFRAVKSSGQVRGGVEIRAKLGKLGLGLKELILGFELEFWRVVVGIRVGKS